MRVAVFHNIATDDCGRSIAQMDGYVPGHPLVPVHNFPEGRYLDGQEPTAICERVFRLFNVGDDPEFGTPDGEAVEYRRWGNRSLCKGDVVLVGDVWFACMSAGWERIPAPRWLAHGALRNGTKSLDVKRWDLPLDDAFAVHDRFES